MTEELTVSSHGVHARTGEHSHLEGRWATSFGVGTII